jgi:hypothetical protein
MKYQITASKNMGYQLLGFLLAMLEKHVVARPKAIDSYDLWEESLLDPQKRPRRRTGLSRASAI